MTPQAIVQAWKDEAFRARLSIDERRQLPEHPSGPRVLNDAASAAGFAAFTTNCTYDCTLLLVPCTLSGNQVA